MDCHVGAEPEGGLDLSSFSSGEAETAGSDWDSAVWEKVTRRLQTRQMPPADADRPGEDEYEQAVAIMSGLLEARASRHPRPGRTEAIRRLTRYEYGNAVRDLLSLEIEAADLLPAEELSHGFDNITVGELSPLLLNRYIAAAERVARLAVGGVGSGPGGITVRLPADRTQDVHQSGLPLGTRGGAVVEHSFTQEGEYEVQLRLARDRDEKVEGLDERHHIDVLLDRRRVHRFTVDPPEGGDYSRADAHLRARFQVTAGPHSLAVTFPRNDSSLLEIKRQPFDAAYNRHRHPRQGPAIFEISIVGPFDPQGPGDTPSRRKIFGDAVARYGENEAAADSILRRLLRQAYRRPVTDADLEVPMQFYREAAAEAGFEAGVESALAAVLVNPNFLFRVERTPEGLLAGEVYRIDPFELASRLSFFLWGSIPDERLLDLAESGELSNPDVLRREVLRMLEDPKVESLTESFAAQWLYLRNLDSLQPDLRLFPDWDDNLRRSLRAETEMLFRAVVCEDRSVLELLSADYTFLDERLATHYGIPGVYGSRMRRVELEEDSRRGGLLRQGSILAVTSYATRTAPTIRGNWVLKNIIGTPPPPPPPNVPALPEKQAGVAAASVRERLAEHRENPACASCHDVMDPLGFALENYDALGRWRDFDGELPIDSSGSMPDGAEVDGVADIEAQLLRRPEVFVQALAERLMVYALGRGIEPSDGPYVRRVVQAAAQEDYRFSALVAAIAASEPFQMRTAE